jgi:hypothetical protein
MEFGASGRYDANRFVSERLVGEGGAAEFSVTSAHCDCIANKLVGSERALFVIRCPFAEADTGAAPVFVDEPPVRARECAPRTWDCRVIQKR